jgi:hypothetical protein
MKLLLEQWRGYLKESVEDLKPISVKDLKHISAKSWSSQDAKNEWVEEVNSSLEKGDDYIGQRWPGLDRKVIEKHYPFFLTAEDFAEALVNAPKENLSPSEMKNIITHKFIILLKCMKKMIRHLNQFMTGINLLNKFMPKCMNFSKDIQLIQMHLEKLIPKSLATRGG